VKERVLWGGLAIVILSWIGNYVYFQSQQLDQPIFLKHYYETSIRDEETIGLTFYYLTNKLNASEVSYVTVDGVEAYPLQETDFQMWPTTTSVPQYEQEFSHHYLKSVRLQFQSSFLPIKKGSDDIWSFDKLDVTFTDGQTMSADIGKVNVFAKEPDYELFDEQVSSSSNQHWSQKSMVTTQPLIIEEIAVPFAEEIGKDIYVKVNLNHDTMEKLDYAQQEEILPEWFDELINTDTYKLEGIPITEPIYPLSLNEGDRLQLSMRFNPNRKSVFEFGMTISGTAVNNEPFLHKAFIIEHPSLSQQSVNEIIKAHKGGNGR